MMPAIQPSVWLPYATGCHDTTPNNSLCANSCALLPSVTHPLAGLRGECQLGEQCPKETVLRPPHAHSTEKLSPCVCGTGCLLLTGVAKRLYLS